jgi:hypothetical protein
MGAARETIERWVELYNSRSDRRTDHDVWPRRVLVIPMGTVRGQGAGPRQSRVSAGREPRRADLRRRQHSQGRWTEPADPR